MKKIYTKIFLIMFIGLIGLNSFSQGTWKAIGTETAISPATTIAMGITNLTSMHSDVANITGKSDATAPTISYNGVDWDNLANLQGSTNGMYFAFLPTMTGLLDIAFKVSSAKTFFVLELTDACWTFLGSSEDLADLTTTFTVGSAITGTPSYFTTPSVYDTYHASSSTWDGSVVFQASGANQWAVMSFAVTAHKTYVIGVNGSKFQLRGVHLTYPTVVKDSEAEEGMMIFPNPAEGNVYVKTSELTDVGIYNASGILVKQQKASPSLNSIDISGLNPGVYYVKTANEKKAQKLIVK